MNGRQVMQVVTVAAGMLLGPAALAQDSFGGSRPSTPPPAKSSAPAPAPVPATPPSTRLPPTASPSTAPPSASAPRGSTPSAQRAPGGSTNPAEAAELQDFGIAPTRQLHTGAMHGPTPTTLPGGLVVTTGALSQLLQQRDGVMLFDVLGSGESLPNALQAAWLSQPGTFNDQVQQQLVQGLQAQTGGRRDVPLVFYCASTQCWMSYNAALRAVNAGYTNVLWYRGGIEAWKAAGLPTMPAGQGR